MTFKLNYNFKSFGAQRAVSVADDDDDKDMTRWHR